MRRKRGKKTAMRLPYDMGNAGDLLKHGVLAEFVRWRREREESFRFIDLFGGEPCNQSAPEDGATKRAEMVAKRVRDLPKDIALRAAQTGIEEKRYYGSGLLVKEVAGQVGKGSVCVLVNDKCEEKRTRLEGADLALLNKSEEFSVSDTDGYAAFEKIVREGKLQKDDLVLIDPFADFLNPKKGAAYKKVIPQIAKAIEQGAAVILFALNEDPGDETGDDFQNLLRKRLPRAWRMTMPPLRFPGIRGESKYHAEVVLAASVLKDEAESNELKKRLEKLAGHLADIPAGQLLKPQTCRP